jgi:hypothetical protein
MVKCFFLYTHASKTQKFNCKMNVVLVNLKANMVRLPNTHTSGVSLEKLAKLEPLGNGKFVGLTNTIADRNIFIDAYEKIKSRPDNMSGQ